MPAPHGNLPRVRTVWNAGQLNPTFELDGVATPESLSFTYAEDLNDDRVKVEVTFMATIGRGAAEPETFAQRGARLRAEEAAELAALTTEWRSARDLHAGSPAVLAALDLHFPRRPWAAVQCNHCQTGSDSPKTDHAPWPCATYTALTIPPTLRPVTSEDVAMGHATINQYRRYIESLDHSLDVPADGEAANAQSEEPVELELIAEPAPSPVTVNITVHGPTDSDPRSALNKQLLAEYRAYPGLFRC